MASKYLLHQGQLPTVGVVMVRYLLGHRIDKHIAEGGIWFTVDNGTRRFISAAEAINHIRRLELAAA